MSLIDLYPDNKNRARRVEELSNDCNLYLNELHDIMGELQISIHEYSTETKKMLESLEIDPKDSRLATKSIDMGHGVFAEIVEYGAEIVGGFVTQKAVSMALLVRMAKNLDSIPIKEVGGVIAGKTITRRVGSEFEYAGSQGLEKIAIKELNFPKWIRFKSFVGGLGAAVVITIAIDLIAEAWRGSDERSELQKAIEGLYGPRARIKMALTINKNLLSIINKTIGNMRDMQELGYTQDQLDKLTLKKANEVKKTSETKTIEQYSQETLDSLKILDKNRGSFTDEDKMDQTVCKDAVCWN